MKFNKKKPIVTFLKKRMVAPSIIVLFFSPLGCTYTHMVRSYSQTDPYKHIQEWKVFADIGAELLHLEFDRNDFMQRFGHPPEEHYCYWLRVWLQLPAKSDSSILEKENNSIKIDSLRVDFSGYSNSFYLDNSYEENERIRDNSPFDRTKVIEIDSLCVTPNIKEVRTKIFGTVKELDGNLQTFEILETLSYKESKKKIGKYD